MQRRDFVRFLSTAGAFGISGLSSLPALAAPPQSALSKWRTFQLTTDVDIQGADGPTHVWLPVPYATDSSYQRGVKTHWTVGGAGQARLINAPGYDVEMLAVRWPDAQGPRTVTLTSQFQTRNRRVDLTRPPGDGFVPESAQALHRYLQPTRLLPTDGIVKHTANQITRGYRGDLEKAKAIYTWVVENTCRLGSVPGCGIGDVAYMLTANDLNGKCADINALFVALARASGIPARDAYGVRVADSAFGYGSLGKAGDVTGAQHCRAEFYAQGYGWVPVDPADVRKVMLEEKPGDLPLTHPKVKAARAMLFGAWEMNWVAYNHGHDVVLPGTRHEPVPFLMYPQGEAGHRFDSLDPKRFSYRMTARQLDV